MNFEAESILFVGPDDDLGLAYAKLYIEFYSLTQEDVKIVRTEHRGQKQVLVRTRRVVEDRNLTMSFIDFLQERNPCQKPT